MKLYIAGLISMLLLAAAGGYSWYRSTYAGQDSDPDELVVQNNFPGNNTTPASQVQASSTGGVFLQ